MLQSSVLSSTMNEVKGICGSGKNSSLFLVEGGGGGGVEGGRGRGGGGDAGVE